MTISVFVVADFEPLRAGIVRTISEEPDLDAVGSCSSLAELVREPRACRSDVLIVDLHTLESGSNKQVESHAQEWAPALKVLFLGSPQEERDSRSLESLRGAMELSAVGFLFKNGPTARLLQAIRMVASGLFVCETQVMRQLLLGLSNWANYEPQPNEHGLSQREVEVLSLVAGGRSNKEIARSLFLSEGTVKAHISHIMNKVGAERRTELVVYALTNGVGVSEDGSELPGQQSLVAPKS